eukprot:101851_1
MDFTSTEMTDDDRGSTTVDVLPPVGSMVRVTTSLEPLQRCRAIVMTVDHEKQSDKGAVFDLLIEEDVEMEFSEEKITHLEEFELDGSINAPPPQDLEGAIAHARSLKDMGNYLFRLADYGAAAGVYEKLLEWLTAVDDASPVADVHCAVYLNMARCLLKKSKNADAVKACTSGAQQGKKYLIRLQEQPGGEKAFPELSQTLRRHCHSAFSLRCQAYLRQNYFREALADVQCMRQTALTDTHLLEADRMAALLERQRDKHQRGNKRLVKEVSKWVDTCMAKQHNVVQSMDVED